MPVNGEFLCPRCGATLPAASAPCPRCSNLYSADSRQAQIESLLNPSLPLERTPPTAPPGPPSAGPAPLQGREPFSTASPPSAESAGSPLPSPSAIRRPRRRLLVFVILVACALLLAAGIYVVYRTTLSYNASPEGLVEGLNTALRNRDEDLLLTLLPPEERDEYKRLTFSSYMEYSSAAGGTKIELVDVFTGEKERYAQVVVSLPDLSSGYRGFDTQKINGRWYFLSDSLMSLPYLE